MTQAINSGQINETRFPGSEDGLSLIELTGVVEATCVITSIGLFKPVSCSTTCSASTGQAQARLRNLLGATTAAQAVVSANAVNKGGVSAASGQAAAQTTARANIRFGASASESASAATSAELRINITLAASASPEAITSASAVFAKTVGATTQCLASTGQPELLRQISVSASTTSVATAGAARAALRLRATASTTCSAVTSVSATDLGVTQRAPDDRRMFVQASNRRMEVTQ